MDGRKPALEQEQQLGHAGHKEASVTQTLVNELAKLGFLCWLIAWALSSMAATDCHCYCKELNPIYASKHVSCRHKQVLLAQFTAGRLADSVRLLACSSTE